MYKTHLLIKAARIGAVTATYTPAYTILIYTIHTVLLHVRLKVLVHVAQWQGQLTRILLRYHIFFSCMYMTLHSICMYMYMTLLAICMYMYLSADGGCLQVLDDN